MTGSAKSDDSTAVLFCPGRGSYGRNELGSIQQHSLSPELRSVLDLADARRREAGLPTVTELDAATQFRASVHLDGENAAELIFFATLASVEALRQEFDVTAIGGNSLGWYTALPAAGALSFEDGWRLVTTMARLQKTAKGGQILTTTVDDNWHVDPSLLAAVDTALAAVAARGPDYFVARSIRLGGHQVLAGTELGVRELLAKLPAIERGDRKFPFQLAGHGPFHTALCEPVAAQASEALRDLTFRPPSLHLIDGNGDQYSPWSADPAQLRYYTTYTQVVATFDFSATVRTALREFQPGVVLCAGPGTSLRAPVGHAVVREGYRGIRDKASLFASELVR